MSSFSPLFFRSAIFITATSSLTAAFAADAVLPGIIVQAQPAPGPTGTPTSPAFTEVRDELVATPGAVNLIPAEAVDNGSSAYLRDLLANQPGVFIQSRHGQGESRVSIRGSGMQRTFHGRGLTVAQDGLPMNYADGGFDMQAFDPAAYAYSRVWRGANGFTQGGGSASLGGVIDFTSYTGDRAGTARGRIEAGSFGYARVAASAGKTTADGDVFGVYSHTHNDGYRDHSAGTDRHLNFNLGKPLSARSENRVYVAYTDTRSKLPGNLTKAQLEDDPRQANVSNSTYDNQRNFTWIRVADRVVAEFDDGRAEFALGYQNKDLDHPISFGTPGFFADNAGSSIQQQTNDLFATFRVDYLADVAGQENRLTLGITPSYGVTDDRRYTNPRGPASTGIFKNRFEETAANLAAFIEEDHYVTKQVALTAGVRADWNRRDHQVAEVGTGPSTTPVSDSRTEDYFGISPRLGARYEFDEQRQTVFTNVSGSFEAPTFSEFNTSRAVWNPSLEAQTATTAELGYRGERAFVGWDATVYHARVDDELISMETQAGGGAVTRNADETIHQGLELGLTLNLLGTAVTDAPAAPKTQKLLFRQVAGWNDFRFHDDVNFGDNRIAGIPEGTYRAELMYEHPNGLYFGPNLEVASKSWVDHMNTLSADAYVIFGFKAGYRPVGKGWSVFGELRNLTDEHYAATTDVVRQATNNQAAFAPGMGASFIAGVECRW